MFFKIIASFIGSVFIVLFLLVLFGLVALLLGASFPETFFNIADLNLNGIIDHDLARSSAGLSLGLILIVSTPLFLLIYFISKLAFGHQGKTGWVLLFAFGLWIAGFIISGKSLLNMIRNNEIPKAWFNNINININDDFISQNQHLTLDSDTLYIDFGASDSISDLRNKNDIYIGNNGKRYVKPGIKIYTSDAFNKLNIKTSIHGFDSDKFNIIVPYKFEDNTLHLPHLVEITDSYSENKSLTLSIKIPTQKFIVFLESQGVENIKSVVFDQESYPISTLTQHVWFTNDDGLSISK
jgi:hypothetical protein